MIFDLTKRKSGGGGNTYILTSYTLASPTTIDNAVNAAHIPIASQNEVLIWNIRGTTKQGAGSIGGKMGISVVQGGNRVAYGGMYRRSSSVVAPDSMTPSANPSNMDIGVTDGYYSMSGTTFYVGAGNTIDFIQIPYNIGWATT